MKKLTDIDIDFADRDTALRVLRHTPASILQNQELKRHNVGVYLHSVPVDPVTKLCSIDYKRAEELGFFKVDFLNVHVYKGVRNRAHLDELLEREPLWEMLDDPEIVEGLFQLHGYFSVVEQMKPRSVEELAMVIAMIRPAKAHLIGKSWDEIRPEIWTKVDNDKYGFKKSHSISYALAIVVQMNLLVETAMEPIEDVYELIESDVA